MMGLYDDTDDTEWPGPAWSESQEATPDGFTITTKPRRKPGRPRGTRAVTQAMVDAIVASDDPHAAIQVETVKNINPAMREFIKDEPRVKLGKLRDEDGVSRVYLFKANQN